MAAPGHLGKRQYRQVCRFQLTLRDRLSGFDSSDSLEIPPRVVMIARRHYR